MVHLLRGRASSSRHDSGADASEPQVGSASDSAGGALWNVSRLFQRRALEAAAPLMHSACDEVKAFDTDAKCEIPPDAPLLCFRDLIVLMNDCSSSTVETQHI
mmetsp:Transcript_76217/g.202536  ORF Transcript_76217/g.202536 Transcript_76217/m.202536 type:complete len:103 (+) Transcript_76217:104-412(+)